MIKENATRYFREVNEMMNKAGRYPFYPYPEDAVASSKIHFDILKQVSYDEIVTFFGCEFEDYEPLRCNNGILERKDGKVFYFFDEWEYVFSDKDGDLILTPYGEPWHKTCVLHNAFPVSKLLEDNLVTLSGGKTYNIDSFCKLLADAILNKQQELDLSEL